MFLPDTYADCPTLSVSISVSASANSSPSSSTPSSPVSIHQDWFTLLTP